MVWQVNARSCVFRFFGSIAYLEQAFRVLDEGKVLVASDRARLPRCGVGAGFGA